MAHRLQLDRDTTIRTVDMELTDAKVLYVSDYQMQSQFDYIIHILDVVDCKMHINVGQCWGFDVANLLSMILIGQSSVKASDWPASHLSRLLIGQSCAAYLFH